MSKPIDFIFSCEHASHALPPGVDLGVSEQDLHSQAAWDPGALALSSALAARFKKHVFAGHFSRLWVDLNRSHDNPEVIPALCYGLDVPGNIELSPAQKLQRLEQYHRPFRHAVQTAVAASIESGHRCIMVSWHSFAPEMFGQKRVDPVGILYDPGLDFEQRIADGLMHSIGQQGFVAKANYPYKGYAEDSNGLYCELRQRFAPEDYAGVEVETRFDGLQVDADIARYVDVYERALRETVDKLSQ